MPYVKIEPSGVQEHRGLVQVRFVMYLEPGPGCHNRKRSGLLKSPPLTGDRHQSSVLVCFVAARARSRLADASPIIRTISEIS